MNVRLACLPLLAACAAQAPLIRIDSTTLSPQCISRVRIFDGTTAQLSEPSDVVIASGRIESIRPAAIEPNPGCIDGERKTLMPALIDSHAHAGLSAGLPPWELRLPDTERQLQMFLTAGITTALIAGASADLHEAMESPATPHVFRASRIVTAKEGHPIPMYKSALSWPLTAMFIGPGVAEVENEAAIAHVVATEVESHPDFIKVVYDAMPPGSPHLTPDELKRIVVEARALGTRVIVHVGSAREAVEAAESGAALIMHVPWEDVLTDDDIARIAATGAPFVTTRHVFASISEVLGERFKPNSLEKALSDGADASFAHRPEGFMLPGFDAAYEANLVNYDRVVGENVKKLFDAHITLLVGTDSGLPGVFQGASIHRELQSLVALGLPTFEVLKSATSTPAQFLDGSRRFGIVSPGAVADLLLVDGNPLEDISATEHIAALWKSGQRVER